MIRPLISILTLYQIDDTLFENMELPARPFTDRGYEDLFLTGWDLNKDTLVENLLMELAELNVLYTDPVFMKYAITTWSKKNKAVWQALYETLFFKYNPVWNKDGTRKHTGKEERDLTNEQASTNEDDNLVIVKGERVSEDVMHDNVHSFEQVDGEQEKTGEDTTTVEYDNTDTLTDTYDSTDTTTVEYGSKIEKSNDNVTTGSKKIETDTTVTPRDTETTEVKVSAFDSAVYNNRDQTTINKGGDITTETDTTETYNNLTVSDDGVEEKTGTDTTTLVKDGSDTHTTEHDGTVTTTIGYDHKITNGSDDTLDVDTWRTNNGKNTDNNQTIVKNKNKGGSKIEDTGTIDYTDTDIEQGNIGVTTTQQMIQAERDLVRFNIYDLIIEDFKQRFCVLIY